MVSQMESLITWQCGSMFISDSISGREKERRREEEREKERRRRRGP